VLSLPASRGQLWVPSRRLARPRRRPLLMGPGLVTPSTQFEYNSSAITTNTQVQSNAVTKGDLICIAVMWRGSGLTLSMTDTVGTVITQNGSTLSSSLNIGGITPWQATIFDGLAGGNAAANGNTITLNFSGAGTSQYVINILEFTGVNARDVLARGGSGTAAHGTINITTNFANEVVVGFGSSGSFGDFAGGLVEQDGPDTGGPASFYYSAWGTYAAAGAQAPEILNNGSQPWNLMVATYYQAVAATPTSPVDPLFFSQI